MKKWLTIRTQYKQVNRINQMYKNQMDKYRHSIKKYNSLFNFIGNIKKAK